MVDLIMIMISDEEIGHGTCHRRLRRILHESPYLLQIRSVWKLYDKLITFWRSDKSVFYRISPVETCFPPTPFPYVERQSESGFTYFNEKLQELQIVFFSFFPPFFFVNTADWERPYLKYFFYGLYESANNF